MHVRQKRYLGRYVKIKYAVSIYLYKKIGYAVCIALQPILQGVKYGSNRI